MKLEDCDGEPIEPELGGQEQKDDAGVAGGRTDQVDELEGAAL